ncbi:MAG TPA: efflux RND transporter permease subunit [Gammaproteobacteria bacterium]|nr:efflux RND transporter permease subunit [Gammaproteobacteria bacterium]
MLGVFARHKVAANLTMALMILAGGWGLSKLNVQFFPNFALDFAIVRVVWSGAAAEDVESAITTPLEQSLRSVDRLHKMSSTSADGVSAITLEFEEGTDMAEALEQVKEKVAAVRNLPADSEEPEIRRAVRYEPIAHLLVSGPADPAELRALVRQMERELLDRGIAKVDIIGLPEEEIAIQIPGARLEALGLTLDQVADRVNSLSQDIPAGEIGEDEVGRQLRALERHKTEREFAGLPLRADSGRLLTLGEVAAIERRARDRSVAVTDHGRPAVELKLSRAEYSDSLAAARILEDWLEDIRARLPPAVTVAPFDQQWQLIEERINLLLKNAGSGLALVLLILFLFLNQRVAFWVAVGIPVSFMAALGVLYAAGGSINMISLFAMIMALGIIVDDAIVVGEDALAHYQKGEPALNAAEGGARRMFAPVLSSSLTTVAAFLPLMIVGGIIGNIMFDIPLVVICVILASLVECFLVLPGHLRHAFLRIHQARPGTVRVRLDTAFKRLRDGPFRRLANWSVTHRWTTIAVAVAVLILSLGLVLGGRINFHFFPAPEGTILYANAAFVAGTPRNQTDAFLEHLEQTLVETDEALGGGLVQRYVIYHGRASAAGGGFNRYGDRLGSLVIELVSPDQREVRNQAFIRAWEARIHKPAGLESFNVSQRQGGPPGREVDVRLVGGGAGQVKAAALELAHALEAIPGVYAVEDDMAYGREQLIYRLTPRGLALGLTVAGVGRQLRAAFDGRIAQIFHDGEDEVEVRVMLPDAERDTLATLRQLYIALPEGGRVPLSAVVEFTARRGFEVLRHDDGRLAVHVTADVDAAVNETQQVLAELEERILPALEARFGVASSFEGRAADQRETTADMKRGAVLGLVLIYLILAWVFASYGWPLVVMAAIPFGLVGAVVGHWSMGVDLSVLSLFGLFGLSGIVVNDSIILVTFYRHLREGGMAIRDAIVEAACQRLRAVLLTSLTTIGGLLPLLFETSLQAQFLIPMAVTISFGLAFSTLLVLLVIPALLSVHESAATVLGRRTAHSALAGQSGEAAGIVDHD